MQSLAEAASELPWLSPCADSLVTLARGAGVKSWSELRSDPGLVLLLLRAAGPGTGASALPFYSALLREPAALSMALECLNRRPCGFVDWSGPLAPIYRAACTTARTAEAIALYSDRCDADHAFVGGLLASLGWLAAAAVDEQSAHAALRETPADGDFAKTQHCLWGNDAAAIARRLAAGWLLPDWLTAIAGFLALPVEAAASLGADPDRFLVVQLAVCLVNQAGLGLAMPVGGTRQELTRALDLSTETLEKTRVELPRFANQSAPPADWLAPKRLQLLPDLLRLALENRGWPELGTCERLHKQVDCLHSDAARHKATASRRLQEGKLSALAELAAGAGHEINNPLAVISGQAQYLLLSEQEPARRKSLQTIISQTQRIHQVLTGLMQFARPPAPQKQPVDLGGLVGEVLGALQPLADERQIQLHGPETVPPVTLVVDPCQMRTMLTALVRNAIEAAPPSGWVRFTIAQAPAGGLIFAVEDSGPGPSTADREHLFDPFYSGRKAGRGRGLGLATAWQLARQHNGEVHFDGDGPTRFVLTIPTAALCTAGQGDVKTGEATVCTVVPLPAETSGEPGLTLLAPKGNGISSHG
jgi:two-component system, NtrC family, sensor kinase